MNKLVLGIHHVTAIASDAQRNLDFYAGILGLRLVKKTINFDAPEVYHLYYGDEEGHPGTIMTFFPYQGIPKGRIGKGQLTATSFSVAEKSLDYWLKRLDGFGVIRKDPQNRFDEIFVACIDGDGLEIELVFNNKDQRKGFSKGHIPAEHAIKGFYGITLTVEGYERTAELLMNQMDHEEIEKAGNRFRYSSHQKPGDFVDILCCPDALRGIGGAGTVHHVAFATENDSTQIEARQKLIKNGIDVTPVLDRQYFHSIYFREPGGVLFEIATIPPGFAIDEDPDHLGEALKLPPWQEPYRKNIEQNLMHLYPDVKKFREL